MESMGIVQARTPESVKENATNILEKLGLNMSTYINMALNQLIILLLSWQSHPIRMKRK